VDNGLKQACKKVCSCGCKLQLPPSCGEHDECED
jgi:hypothetical protein